MRHFLQILDASRDELLKIIKEAVRLRKTGYEGEPIKGKIVAMIFEKPSTRTRVSFTSAILKLGGEVIYLPASELQLARGEPLKDTARVLSRYVDALVARLNRHSSLEEIARHSSVPVINALTDLHHPCQALADIATMYEHAGGLGFNVSYVGDCGNVCRSLLQICALLGIPISVASPRKYWPAEQEIQQYKTLALTAGSRLEFTEDPEEAVAAADFIYTDVFVSMGMESEYEARIRDFLPRYQVSTRLFEKARPNAKFMHCMPIRRGEEVEDEVVESGRSIIFDQAEYRMHTSAALIVHLLGGSR
ncbi:MAG: ornithine carbamoyltransferase [Nitrososphaerota archaeon]|nr:ornithine carbamoyltransferase [Candidatus Calditenuaceae archaeon]MDW8072968.1 ornithine carbamoyltransferase [Nitrososphaerota archaeon]